MSTQSKSPSIQSMVIPPHFREKNSKRLKDTTESLTKTKQR